MSRSNKLLVAIAVLATTVVVARPGHADFIPATPTDTWSMSSGLPTTDSANNTLVDKQFGIGTSADWISDQNHPLTLDAFYMSSPSATTVSNQARLTLDPLGAGPQNGGFGVCSQPEFQNNQTNCTQGTGVLQINYGTANGTQLDILRAQFNGATPWIPVGASFAETAGSMHFDIYGSNGTGDFLSDSLTMLGQYEGPSWCGPGPNSLNFYTTPQDPSQLTKPPAAANSTGGVEYGCFQTAGATGTGNHDQFFFNNTNTFKFLFFAIDTATADTTGNESFFLSDVEGVQTAIPEPSAVLVFGTALLGVSILARRRRMT
jgi:hypothetical protein